jgi:hypothetical protein
VKVHPKFVAVRSFSCAGEQFAVGDPVPAGLALTTALRFGDRFVARKPKTSPAGDAPVTPIPDAVSVNPEGEPS